MPRWAASGSAASAVNSAASTGALASSGASAMIRGYDDPSAGRHAAGRHAAAAELRGAGQPHRGPLAVRAAGRRRRRRAARARARAGGAGRRRLARTVRGGGRQPAVLRGAAARPRRDGPGADLRRHLPGVGARRRGRRPLRHRGGRRHDDRRRVRRRRAGLAGWGPRRLRRRRADRRGAGPAAGVRRPVGRRDGAADRRADRVRRPARGGGGPVNTVSAVVFDLGGVITESPMHAFAAYEADASLPDGLIRRLNSTDPDSNAWARYERRELDEAGFRVAFEAEAAAAGFTVDAGRVLAGLHGDVRPAMVTAVRRLRDAGLPLGLLSNNVAPMERTGW